MKRTRILSAVVCVVFSAIATRGAGAPPAILHRFLAVDTLAGKQGLHHIDQADSANDWHVAGTWRDLQLIGDHRVALSDGDGVSIVDLKTRRVVGRLRPPGLSKVLSFHFLPDGGVIYNRVHQGLLVSDPLGLTQRNLIKIRSNGMVRPTGDGGWTFTQEEKGYLVTEVAANGEVRRSIPVTGTRPIYTACKLTNGNYLLTAGYGGFAAEINPAGETVRRFSTEKRFFYSGFQVLTNGNLVVANWTGHNEAERRKPNQGDQIIEFSAAGDVVWSFNDPKKLGCIHGVIILDGLDTALPHEQVHGVIVPVPAQGAATNRVEVAGANSLDGLAVLPDGAVALSVPNLTDRAATPAIVRVARSGTISSSATAPGPGSERAVPFGMDAGPDGTIYVADNQFFSETKPKPPSRLLAVGAGGAVRVVATGLRVANGVRVHKEHVYVTDSQLSVADGKVTSALFRFPVTGAAVAVSSDPLRSRYLVARFETAINRDPFGADGIVFDAQDRALVSFFDAGLVLRLHLGPDGKAVRQEEVIAAGILPSADGMAFDQKTGTLLIADPRSNSLHTYRPGGGLRILARSGLLDLPVDVVVQDGAAVVSNWTSPKQACRLVRIPIPAVTAGNGQRQ